ncbi:MAG: AAA family ATPase [Rhodospirillales bacterium]|nr:AAA family ATPase [Rhodospirillales bacterium]
MIRRFYIHNFRCLDNFELRLDKMSSVLLIGKNGAGKTTVGRALEVLQRIARGVNRVGELVSTKDLNLSYKQSGVPVRFELEVDISSKAFTYVLVLELVDGFKELRVKEERLVCDEKTLFKRELAQVELSRQGRDVGAKFSIDWHLVALPIVQPSSTNDPISIFKEWLANTLILRPVPSQMRGGSEKETLRPDPEVVNFGEWFTNLLISYPAAYGVIEGYLKEVMPDFQAIKNPQTGRDSRSLFVSFSNNPNTIELLFEDLSDGEKCFLTYALVIAANDAYGPLLCFWDEPDNFLAPQEVASSIVALRRAFRAKGQLILTSHNIEAMGRFSDENTLVLLRKSHLEPMTARFVGDFRDKGELTGDFAGALLRGDLIS